MSWIIKALQHMINSSRYWISCYSNLQQTLHNDSLYSSKWPCQTAFSVQTAKPWPLLRHDGNYHCFLTSKTLTGNGTSGMRHCDKSKHLFNTLNGEQLCHHNHKEQQQKLEPSPRPQTVRRVQNTETGSYLETVQTDETGYSKSINNILLLRTRLASLPPGGSRGLAGGSRARRSVFTGTSLPFGTRRGAPILGFPGARLPFPSPLALRTGSATLLHFPFHFKIGAMSSPRPPAKIIIKKMILDHVKTNRFHTINKAHP